MTKAIPKYQSDQPPEFHWVKGTDDIESHPDLKAIADAAAGMKEKPNHFEVNGKLYSLSNKIWKELNSKKERKAWQEKIARK